MIDLFLSDPNQSDEAHDRDSIKWRISLLKEMESVIWSGMLSGGRAEVRLWLCSSIAGVTCVAPRDQRELFGNLVRSRGQKCGLASHLLHLMFDKSPNKGGSILAHTSRILQKFFQGNPNRVLQWFSYSSSGSGLEQGKGLKALSQFAFKNRDICWEELEWKGKHGQSPAMVATKPHYFLDLDIQRTVENFIQNVPEFWSSDEFVESVKDGDIFFIDRPFFVHYFINLMYKEDIGDVWQVIDEFLTEHPFSSLCQHLLITLDEQDLCYFLELLRKSLNRKVEFQHFDNVTDLFVVVLLNCGGTGSIDLMLLLNAVITQGRQLLRLLRDEEDPELQAKIGDTVSKISAIPSSGNSLTPIFKNTCKMTTVETIKCLGLQSWVLYYRLSQECKTPESWESVFMNNQIGFRLTNKNALLDHDGRLKEDCSGFDQSPSVRLKRNKKQKAKKKRRRKYDSDDCNDDELLDFDSTSLELDFLHNTRSWLLSTDGYTSAWSSADLPEHLHRHCLCRWMTWLLEK
ncbi:uncharacterized protein LOC130966067 isoform X1 [Arachis stenosperma]|uniref:uncharacterized protein LOC130966067 isoform X1 n=1 Tax=Arachis stenosperma TaxID=217475 RepID=UPI0025AC26FC|nr:uncharacterized protein LOC130966067 isoform X1 [Arachis stenosperma]